jgi:cytoskeletal protein RodZ
LREVSKNTKVKEHLLKAIEEDQYSSLPSGTYVKGFLLAYAKYLGLDPNDVLLRYESGLRGKPIPWPEAPPEKEILWSRKYLWMIGGVIVVGLAVSYFLFLRPSKLPVESISVKPRVEETLPSAPAPPPAAAVSTQEEQPFSLQLKAIEETWVRIQVDGELEKEMTLNPGEMTSHRAMKRIYLLVGNAGGLDLIFKGKSLERFGKSGEVVTLIFTPQGVEKKRLEMPRPKPE